MGNRVQAWISWTESNICLTWWLSASSPAPWRFKRTGKEASELSPVPKPEGGIKMAYDTTPLGCRNVTLCGSLLDLRTNLRVSISISQTESVPAFLKLNDFVNPPGSLSTDSMRKPIGLD